MNRRVTLKDLSAETGFDKSTISRVLRDDVTLSIRPDNAELIKKAARDFGYVANVAGRSLRSALSHSLGAVVPSLQNQIHAQMIEGAQSVCMSRGYSLQIAQAQAGESQVELFRQLVKEHHVDGLMVLTFRNESSLMPDLPELRELGVPIIIVNWWSDQFENWVLVPDRAGSATATRHLIDLGHRKIAHLSGDRKRYNAEERFQGYCDALRQSGIAYDPGLVEEAGYTFQAGVDAMNRLLDRRQGDFSAISVVSLLTAAGAIQTLHNRGVNVPGDVSLIGFHDGVLAEAVTPTISTIAYPLAELGRYAADGIIDILSNKRSTVMRVIDDGRIIQRESTAPPPQ